MNMQTMLVFRDKSGLLQIARKRERERESGIAAKEHVDYDEENRVASSGINRV